MSDDLREAGATTVPPAAAGEPPVPPEPGATDTGGTGARPPRPRRWIALGLVAVIAVTALGFGVIDRKSVV